MKKAFLDINQIKLGDFAEITVWLRRNLDHNTYRLLWESADVLVSGYEFDNEADLIMLRLAVTF